MVAAFDYCLHGKGGAAPSIDTAMHGLVDAAHVDHLHPDSGIAIATAADGEELTTDDLRRQGRVGAVAPPGLPARPRHRRDQGGEPAGGRLHPRRPRHHRVGRHQRGGRGQLALDHRHRRAPTSPSTRRPSRSVRALEGYAALPEAERRAKAAALAPTIRGIASRGPPDGRPLHRRRRRPRLPGARRAPAPRPSSARRAPTTSCAPRSSRWSSTCPPTASVEETHRPPRRSSPSPTARTTRATTTATPRPTAPRSAARTR